MAIVTMDVQGGKEFALVVNRLVQFGRNPNAQASATFRNWAAKVATRFKGTPYGRKTAAQQAGQGYVRTGIFGRSWRSKQLGNSHHMIQNFAQQKGRVYGSYVVGDGQGRGQARIHASRWWKARPLFEERDMHELVIDIEKLFKGYDR
jgi:hypothetical protein